MADGSHVDPTKHRVAGDRVTWMVRSSPNHSGKAEVVFRGGKIESFAFEMQERPDS